MGEASGRPGWARSRVRRVTLSKTLPHSVRPCKMSRVDSWSHSLCVCKSKNAQLRESKLLGYRHLDAKRGISVMLGSPGSLAVNLSGCLDSFCQHIGDGE